MKSESRKYVSFPPPGVWLIGYEESQVVATALRDRGIEAYSNDLKPCSGGHPEYHIQMDFFEAYALLNPVAVIAFHPCDHLSKAGGAHWRKPEKQKAQFEALVSIRRILSLPCFVALENPVGKISTAIRKPDQIIHPYQFGHPFTKETCLWLKGFQKLRSTDVVEPTANWVKPGNKRNRKFNDVPEGAKGKKELRSKTFPGIARAMATQWTPDLTSNQ